VPLIDGLSRRQLQEVALRVLLEADTIAGTRIYEPRDWPTTPDYFPMLLVSTPRERNVGGIPGMLMFDTTFDLVVTGRVMAGTDSEANALLTLLEDQIKAAVMLTLPLETAIQRFASMETASVVSAAGRNQIGELAVVFSLEVYQAYGPRGTPLSNITAAIQVAQPPAPETSGTPLISVDVTFEDPSMKVKPASDGLIVRHPIRGAMPGRQLRVEGEEVPDDDNYWNRRLAAGDVVRVEETDADPETHEGEKA
jgi:hypothetical protein